MQESPFLRAAAFRLFGEMAARVGHVEQVGIVHIEILRKIPVKSYALMCFSVVP